MVFVNLNLILVVCAAAAAVAAPVNDDSAPVLVPRAEVSVFMCTDRGFRGDCMNDLIQTGSCCELIIRY